VSSTWPLCVVCGDCFEREREADKSEFPSHSSSDKTAAAAEDGRDARIFIVDGTAKAGGAAYKSSSRLVASVRSSNTVECKDEDGTDENEEDKVEDAGGNEYDVEDDDDEDHECVASNAGSRSGAAEPSTIACSERMARRGRAATSRSSCSDVKGRMAINNQALSNSD
jgi:hypothetical protein